MGHYSSKLNIKWLIEFVSIILHLLNTNEDIALNCQVAFVIGKGDDIGKRRMI